MPQREQLEGVDAPEQLGPFRLLRELGSGAMGSVYLAEDRDEERQVALKVLHPYLLKRKGFFQRFQREALAGQRVEHPNVVRTLDCSFHVADGTPYCVLVMEYVQGRTLREMLREHSTLPEALVREIARQVAAGLTAIHAAGIVHRDLKPENVLITDDHRVRIMDLGVARHTELATELTQEGQFAGSLLYAAPEQLRGNKVGPAADLYALGVMLYEFLSGINPFRHDDPGAVFGAHLEAEPDRLDRRTEEVSVFFSELIGTLLAKRPEERIADATVLGKVLAEGEQSSWWTARERTILRERERRPHVPVRRETKLYGRETELALCREAWERAKAKRGNVLLLKGEAGIGKSRLVDAFLSELDGGDAHVLYGSYPPSGGMGGISDAILTKFGRAELEESLKPYLTVTPSLVPAFAAVMKREPPPEGRTQLQGDALHAVCVHFMRALAEEKPLLWMVEDLHFADSDSRKLLLSLARAVEGHPVLLLATTRPGIPEDELTHFGRLDNFRRAALGRLSAREVVLLLQDAFRSEMLADKLAGRIAFQSDGIPFFIFEMIRGLKEGQFITQLPDGSWVESKVVEKIAVPPAVKDLIEVRLRDLTREDRAVLDVGSVLGYEFDPDLIASVLRRERVAVLQDLAEAERRSGVVRSRESSYRFDHHQIQEVVHAALPQGLRQEYHTALATVCAERCGDSPKGDDAIFIAHHHLRGIRPGDGLACLVPALDHLEGAYRNEEVIDLAVLALDTPKLLEGKDRLQVLLRKAVRHDLRGDWHMERAALDEALALVDSSEDAAWRSKVRQRLGSHLTETADYAAAQGCLEHALDLALEAEDKEAEVDASRGLGGVLQRQGRLEEARAQIEKSLALSREIGDRRREASAIGDLGVVFISQGRYEEARAQHEKCLALSREIGDRRGEAIARGNLGVTFQEQGRYEEARAQYGKSLALAREMGDRRTVTKFTGNLGNIFHSQGRYDEARAQHEKHLALAREIGARGGEAAATANLSNIFHSQGRYDEARAQHEKYLALAREMGDRIGEATATGNLGLVFWAQGDYGKARAQYEKKLALAREIGARESEGIALVNLGPTEAKLGQTDRAQETLNESLRVLREIGARSPEGYALERLGSVAEQQGKIGEARRFYEDALALRREIRYPSGVSSTLIALGRLEVSQGNERVAAAYIDEALVLAENLHSPDLTVSATVQRARLPGGDRDAAVAALEEHEENLPHGTKMEARFRLWELTNDRAHLTEAKRLLDFAVDHSPEDCRTSMIENVPLHRDIMPAWEEHGEKE